MTRLSLLPSPKLIPLSTYVKITISVNTIAFNFNHESNSDSDTDHSMNSPSTIDYFNYSNTQYSDMDENEDDDFNDEDEDNDFEDENEDEDNDFEDENNDHDQSIEPDIHSPIVPNYYYQSIQNMPYHNINPYHGNTDAYAFDQIASTFLSQFCPHPASSFELNTDFSEIVDAELPLVQNTEEEEINYYNLEEID